MKSVLLEGLLGEKFGRTWCLDVNSPAEAIRAIEANRPGFAKYLADSEADQVRYQILLDEEEIEPERLHGPFSSREVFRMVPVIGGADQGGVKAIIGIAIIVAAFILAPPSGVAASGAVTGGMGATIIGGFTYANLGMLGAAMVLGGISMSMASQPQPGGEKGEGSSVFNGPANTVTQGGPVPIGYGRLMLGSILISGGIRVNETRAATGRGDTSPGDVRFIPE